MSHPLFTSGTARCGTNLRSLMLSLNKDICLAIDPFLPLFRELRNAILRRTGDADVMAALDPGSSLDDYYFSPVKRRAMNYVQQSTIEIPFDTTLWPTLRESLVRRQSLASADLIECVDLLPAASFQGMFRNALKLIEDRRHAEGCKWVGFNDNWAVEFFAPLARAFPDSRFMIHLRDPRAAIDGALHAETDPRKIPHVISFARHWRKYVAFLLAYRKHPLFKNRLYISLYEPMVSSPEKHLREMTEFLEVEFDPAMLDTKHFRTAMGERWEASWDIYHASVDMWKTRLPKPVVEVIEFICDPEMRLLGYVPVHYSDAGLSAEALRFIMQDARECEGWRSDFNRLEKDVGSELFRKVVVANRNVQWISEDIEQAFLFTEAYEQLRIL